MAVKKVNDMGTKSVDIKGNKIGEIIIENNNNDSRLKPKTKFWVSFNKSEINDMENDDKDFELVSKEPKEKVCDVPGKIQENKFRDERETDNLQNYLESWVPFNRKQNPLHEYVDDKTKIVGISV